MAAQGQIEEANTALREGRWEDARSAFEREAARRETAEALDGLAEALWWLGRTRDSVRHRERAFTRFREAGQLARAGMAAIALSISYLVNLGNPPAARGWLARAERVVDGSEPNPLQGWLWLMHGFMADDLEAAWDLLNRALDFARSSGDADLELLALSDLGTAAVRAGRVDEGLALLDEAMAGTLAGEYTRLDTVVFTTCNMLAACGLAGDLERATQWCRAADRFMERYGSPFMYATCRAHYGGVLVKRGRWPEAEGELQAALRMSEDAGPGARSEALARLAELRFVQGRLEEAEALLETLGEEEPGALPAAAIRLARGEAAVAAAHLERHLTSLGERHVETAPTLGLLVDAHIAAGDLDEAAAAAARLETAADALGRPHAKAIATLASARLAAARGRMDEAIGGLEQALERFGPLGLPLEAARVRIELARALVGSNPEVAIAEAERALTTFEELGAGADADAAASLLRSLGVRGRTGPKRGGTLTKREQEVLALVAEGLSNPEIAQRLYISRKTAAHHVSSVLAKLGLRNRAEAAAHSARNRAER